MGIKQLPDGTFKVSYSKRHPITRQPVTLFRITNNKGEVILSKAEAQRVYNDLVIKVEQRFEEHAGGKMTLFELRRRFIESLQARDLSPATVDNYRNCLDAHTKCWNIRPIESIRTDEIRTLIKVTLAERSQSHQKSMHKFLKGLFNYAVECGYLQRSPVPMLQFRLGDKIKKVLTIEIAPPLVGIIKQLYAEEPESTFVLPRIRELDEGRQAEVLRTFLMGIGLPPVRFHDLRASWATAMLGMGVEPARVMIMGGWSDLKTMQIYMRKAGISIKGMTDGLNLHDPNTKESKVINMFERTV